MVVVIVSLGVLPVIGLRGGCRLLFVRGQMDTMFSSNVIANNSRDVTSNATRAVKMLAYSSRTIKPRELTIHCEQV